MKLATLKTADRDGELLVVARNLATAVSARHVAPNLMTALERWEVVEPALQSLYAQLNAGTAHDAVAFDPKQAAAPLPRAK